MCCRSWTRRSPREFSMCNIAVVDASYNGVACIMMMTSSEKADDIKHFGQVTQDKAGVNCKRCMIDKSLTKMRAARALGIMHLLCIFHIFQDWDRFLKTTKACCSTTGITRQAAICTTTLASILHEHLRYRGCAERFFQTSVRGIGPHH